MKRFLPGLALLAILCLAAGLRFYRLDAQSFWNDEGNSVSLSGRPVELIVEGTAQDIHPPLYYLLLHEWRRPLGDSEFAVRALSAFAGVLLVAGTFALGRCLLRQGDSPALLAALVAALNPALIYYSQEARMYELLGLLAVLVTLCLGWVWPSLSGRRRAFQGLAYFLLVVAGLYTHYFFAAVLLAHAAVLLVSALPRGREGVYILLRWGGLLGLALLAYLPWLPIFLRQTGGRPGDSAAVWPFLRDAARWLLFGPTIEAGSARWPSLAFALVLLLGLLPLTRANAPSNKTGPNSHSHATSGYPNLQSPISNLQSPISLLSLALVPIAFMLVAGTTRPAYFKFMIVSIPFLALLAGRGAFAGWRLATRGGWVRWPLLLLLSAGGATALWGSGRSLQNLYFNPAYARDDYRGIAAAIAAEDHPSAGIILNAPNQWEVFTYYHEGGAPVYPLPQGNPDREELTTDLAAIAGRHDRIYALFWGEAERDPERAVERWLDANAYKATERWVGGVRFVTYAVPQEPAEAPQPQANTDLHFGGRITLTGYAIQGEPVAAGDILQVTLFWRADRLLEERYKVFLHLVNEAGVPVAQRDSEPGGGLAPTSDWAPGEQVIDNHGIFVPAATPPGEYLLNVGLYELGQPTVRLPLSLDGSQADFYSLATVRVLP